MSAEPISRQRGRFIQGAWLLEQMRGAGDDLELVSGHARKLCDRLAVQIQDHFISALTMNKVGESLLSSMPALAGIAVRDVFVIFQPNAGM